MITVVPILACFFMTAGFVRGNIRGLQSSGFVGFKLVHVPSNVELWDILNGDVIDIASLGVTASFNIKAVPMNSMVRSVKSENGRIDSVAPFSRCGNSGEVYRPCSHLVVGPNPIIVSATSTDASKRHTVFDSFSLVHVGQLE
jgi:hypothetical protein